MLERVGSAMEARRAVPLLVGPNTTELRAFLRRIATTASLPEETIYIKKEPGPRLDDKMLYGDSRIIAILNGDDVSEAIQLAWSTGELMERIKLLLLVVTSETQMWNAGFSRNHCVPTVRWPSWKARRADRNQIVTAMCRRIGSGRKRGTPTFHTSAVNLLREHPFKGTDDAFALLRRGYARYCAQESLLLTAEHLIGPELRAASSRPTVVPSA